jgi:hypothetical protein
VALYLRDRKQVVFTDSAGTLAGDPVGILYGDRRQAWARYVTRWAIEVTFFDTRRTLGVGQARNRTAASGESHRGVRDVRLHHRRALVRGVQTPVRDRRGPPYPRTVVPVETDLSFADMLTALRRTLIAARFSDSRSAQPTNAEIRQVQRAWAFAAA